MCMARGSKRVGVFLEDQGINAEVRNLDKPFRFLCLIPHTNK